MLADSPDPEAYRSLDFSFRIGLSFPAWVHDLRLADINRDGKLDLVACGDSPGPNYLFIYPGEGNFEFGDPVYWNLPSPPLRLDVGNLNGDSYDDVAVMLPAAGQVGVLVNTPGPGQGQGISLEFQYFALPH